MNTFLQIYFSILYFNYYQNIFKNFIFTKNSPKQFSTILNFFPIIKFHIKQFTTILNFFQTKSHLFYFIQSKFIVSKFLQIQFPFHIFSYQIYTTFFIKPFFTGYIHSNIHSKTYQISPHILKYLLYIHISFIKLLSNTLISHFKHFLS